MNEDITELWPLLTDSEKEAWDQLKSTLDSSGMKLISRDMGEVFTTLNSQIFSCENWDQYLFIRGQLDAFRVFLNLEGRALNQLSMAVQERAEADAEAEIELPTIPVENFV